MGRVGAGRLIGLLLMLGSIAVSVQTYTGAQVLSTSETYLADSTIYTLAEVDSLPQWPGGRGALIATLDSLVDHSPRQWAEVELQRMYYGFVVVRFVIEPDGSMTHLEIYHGVEPRLDREALRIIALLPRWQPAIRRGQVVRVGYYLPVKFSPLTPLSTSPPTG